MSHFYTHLCGNEVHCVVVISAPSNYYMGNNFGTLTPNLKNINMPMSPLESKLTMEILKLSILLI